MVWNENVLCHELNGFDKQYFLLEMLLLSQNTLVDLPTINKFPGQGLEKIHGLESCDLPFSILLYFRVWLTSYEPVFCMLSLFVPEKKTGLRPGFRKDPLLNLMINCYELIPKSTPLWPKLFSDPFFSCMQIFSRLK